MPADPTQRFSSRVAAYVKSRPGYPAALLDHLEGEGVLSPGAIVADVGSGTGILTAALRGRCAHIHAVEPNDAMRAVAPEGADITHWPGAAEETGLPDASVDVVCAAQAFHWFDPPAARVEFARILRPGGRVALIWNTRQSSSAFLRGYEAALQAWGTDYAQVTHRSQGPEQIGAFFAPARWARHTFDNVQFFDEAGLITRVRSSSYTPEPGHPRYERLMGAMRALFAEHQEGGSIAFRYTTELYLSGSGL